MIAIATLGPVATLLVLVALHIAYYRRCADRSSQQVIDPIDRPAPAAENLGGEGWRAFTAFADRQGEPPTAHTPAAAIAAKLDSRLLLKGETTLPSGQYVDVLVCLGDLIVEGECTFLSPVKVDGDLVIKGDATFLSSTVVSGCVEAIGTCAFPTGLIAKGDVVVSGTLSIGTVDRAGWFVARDMKFKGAGKLSAGTVPTSEKAMQPCAAA